VGQPAEDQQDNQDESFPVVGIGASAGGLEAFTQLLKYLPVDTGMAFVLIQHLSPDYRSLLPEILARATLMPLQQVEEGMAVEPNHVYVIPPDAEMTLAQGVFQLTPREKTQRKFHPVNAFFHSLAARDSRAIGIVLSGTDGDGALGLEAIKIAGGITFAQCEATAQFDGMPSTAIATGQVDFILPPQQIAEELAKISRHPYVSSLTPTSTEDPDPVQAAEGPASEEDDFSAILALLQARTGVEFTHYKYATLERRIKRRMVLYHLERLADYVRYLQDNPAEVQALYQDVLISVTNFFRDPEAFAILKGSVFPRLIQRRSAAEPIRIWVPGCATGEEVYSLAICLLEVLTERAIKLPLQIFGTDLSERVIETARRGIYRQNLMVNVSPERLQRFFVQVEGGYQICKWVREQCVFARHNLVSDPPFSNLDMISCRNVLIYFGPSLQKRVLPVFHYSLNAKGFLLLGTSEGTGESSDLFAVVDKKYKIYAKKPVPPRLKFDFVSRDYPMINPVPSERPRALADNGLDLRQQADQIVLNRYGPVGVVINEQLDILHFRGETSPYLRPAPGEPSFNLEKMARPGLLLELRTAIYQAQQQDVTVSKSGLRIEKEQLGEVRLEVIPFQAPPAHERYYLVLFEVVSPVAAPPAVAPHVKGSGEPVASETKRLQQELAAAKQDLADTQAYLQSIIEEQQTTTQNLMAANEEILSSNEELQSTNEELQTAKEEIQATNEELKTTNDELQSRNLEARQANDDLINLLSSVNIPILMLDGDLGIRRFTPTAQRLFNLLPSDVGRPLSHIRPNLSVFDLEALILEVIDTLIVKELEVQDWEGRWYSLRIRPYKTTENRIDGAVVTLLDIDDLRRSVEQLRESRDYAEAIVQTVREPLVVLNADLAVCTANRSFYQMFQVSPAETEQCLIFELGNGQWEIPGLRTLLEEMLPQSSEIQDFEVEHDFEQIGTKTMLLSARRLLQATHEPMILLGIQDITERKQLLQSEQAARAAAEAANASKDEFISILSHELRTPLNAVLGWAQLLLHRHQDEATTTRALETIERNAKLQSQLIGDLLDVSRIVQGKLQLECRPVNLAPIIQAVVHTMQPTADQKRVQLEARLASGSETISADPGRMQQVIWNLLANAIKFTPEHGRVEVRLEYSSSHAQVQVIDTGKGISPEFLPYVFERFRQAESTETRAHGGLGLGLAIVRRLVELHGGTVGAESLGEGQGATFTVLLPLVPQSQMSQGIAPESPPDLRGIKVLLVDDDEDLRELFPFLLEQAGVIVTATASAEEALAALSQFQPDLLVSDIAMPEVDGYGLIQRVRALPPEQGGQVLAIALTAYAEEVASAQAIAAGFQSHVPKPVEIARLVEVIASLVGRGSNG